MKTTGKILFGFLSVTALVGTGVASWIVNNNYQTSKSINVDSTVETEIINKDNSVTLDIVETDPTLKFASLKEGEDLSLTYTLKASEKDYDNLDKYASLAEEYVPNIKVSLSLTKVGTTDKEEDRVDVYQNVKKYLVLPEDQVLGNIRYDEWLSESSRVNGYSFNYNFLWNTNELHENPEVYANSENFILPNKTKEEITFEDRYNYLVDLTNTLKDVRFRLVFTVGTSSK